MFPTGLPGVGLIAVRVTVAAMLLVNESPYTATPSMGREIGSLVAAVCLVIGILTPYAATFAGCDQCGRLSGARGSQTTRVGPAYVGGPEHLAARCGECIRQPNLGAVERDGLAPCRGVGKRQRLHPLARLGRLRGHLVKRP